MTTSKLLFAYFITFAWTLILAFCAFSFAYFIGGYLMGHFPLYTIEVLLSIVGALASRIMFYGVYNDLYKELDRMHRKHRRTLRLKARRK